ncbi:P-loop containing nucleoside triphosphate hydrolase protein [Coprinopsis sp. MPI-PUGE-AT-0042]|nr:P-loop containing nucleoside triphosphate hydrolase protein [Coprinopsis sp. MPI-PUGE-AT-0042]
MGKKANGTSRAWKRKLVSRGDFVGNEDDIVILVMGPTGVGKSTFIKEYTGNKEIVVGSQLQSCTRDVSCFEAPVPVHFPLLQGRRLLLVDTPGFDDTFSDDSEILERIAAWLAQAYNEKMHIAGIVYLHDVSTKRMFGSTRTNLKLFTKLCGGQFFSKVVLVTSQWDCIQEATGIRREEDLRTGVWKDLCAHGATVMRKQTHSDHHNDIINRLLNNHLEFLTALPVHNGSKANRLNTKLQRLEEDMVILLIGPTGAGKSTFIKEYTGKEEIVIGTALTSCTRNVTHYEATLPSHFAHFAGPQGRRLFLVDGPGFDDTHLDDNETLKRVADFLAQLHGQRMRLVGVVYVYDISEKKMRGSADANIKMFNKLCDGQFAKVVLATSQWDSKTLPDEATGIKREKELKEGPWKSLCTQGATVMRKQKTPDDHNAIISYLLSNYLLNHVNLNETLLIQQEIVDLQRNIPETQAGKELRHNLLELLALQRAAESINLDDQDKKELTMRRRQVKDQMQNLELSWGDRFKKLFGLF